MKTKNISESLGYIIAINDVLSLIKEMPKEHDLIYASDLIDKIVVGKKDLSIQEGEYYTMDMIDPKKPFKPIAGEDALFLNPVYERNCLSEEENTTYIINPPGVQNDILL